ncbi:hypothetical protein P9Y72_01210 [Bacillus cereus]|nr:hypothetical protein [Bacillus cereus]
MNYIESFQCYLQEEGKRHRTIQEYVASVVGVNPASSSESNILE